MMELNQARASNGSSPGLPASQAAARGPDTPSQPSPPVARAGQLSAQLRANSHQRSVLSSVERQRRLCPSRASSSRMASSRPDQNDKRKFKRPPIIIAQSAQPLSCSEPIQFEVCNPSNQNRKIMAGFVDLTIYHTFVSMDALDAVGAGYVPNPRKHRIWMPGRQNKCPDGLTRFRVKRHSGEEIDPVQLYIFETEDLSKHIVVGQRLYVMFGEAAVRERGYKVLSSDADVPRDLHYALDITTDEHASMIYSDQRESLSKPPRKPTFDASTVSAALTPTEGSQDIDLVTSVTDVQHGNRVQTLTSPVHAHTSHSRIIPPGPSVFTHPYTTEETLNTHATVSPTPGPNLQPKLPLTSWYHPLSGSTTLVESDSFNEETVPPRYNGIGNPSTQPTQPPGFAQASTGPRLAYLSSSTATDLFSEGCPSQGNQFPARDWNPGASAPSSDCYVDRPRRRAYHPNDDQPPEGKE